MSEEVVADEVVARVVVAGGANMDVKARSTWRLVPATSNPGISTSSPGGVGRNVAENLARLGHRVALVAAVGEDPLGAALLAATAAAGVDVGGVSRDAPRTGTYTALLDHDGELVAAVADMAATDAIGPADLDQRLRPALPGAALLVLDGNLAPPALAHALDLAAAAGVPVVLEPVSGPKAARVAGVLSPARPVLAVTPNADELAALTGTEPGAGVEVAAAALHDRGVTHVWTHVGTGGSVLHTAGSSPVRVAPVAAREVVDVTGAGDALVAGFCSAVLSGTGPLDAARTGHRAAALTVASTDTVRPDLAERMEEER